MALTKSQMVFQSAMRLRDVKPGDIVTPQHMEALNFFLGDLIETVRKVPMKQSTIEFRDGVPVVTKDEIGIKVTKGSDEETE